MVLPMLVPMMINGGCLVAEGTVRVQALDELRGTRFVVGKDMFCTTLDTSLEGEGVDDNVRHC